MTTPVDVEQRLANSPIISPHTMVVAQELIAKVRDLNMPAASMTFQFMSDKEEIEAGGFTVDVIIVARNLDYDG